jgi:hypothetical protein
MRYVPNGAEYRDEKALYTASVKFVTRNDDGYKRETAFVFDV